jgi:hypothetical protein
MFQVKLIDMSVLGRANQVSFAWWLNTGVGILEVNGTARTVVSQYCNSSACLRRIVKRKE